MILKSLIIITISCFVLRNSSGQGAGKRLVCYYDVDSPTKIGRNKFTPYFFDKALVHCTHLVYGFGRLNAKTFELTSPTQEFPNPAGLKLRYPHLKIYLSVGGDKDYDSQNPLKYVSLLESERVKQHRFISSSLETIQNYGFNGLDLAFALPRNEPRKDNSMAMLWNDVTNMFSDNSKKDAYKDHYTRFISDLKQAFNAARLTLTMTVLPNVNSTWFFDIAKIHNDFEFINLFAFDFNTPERNPKEADYSAPLHFKNEQNRLSYANIDFQIDYWLNNGCPASKLNLGIATYGRVWRLTGESGLSGQTVVQYTNGPGHVVTGKQNTGGSISWTDICFHLPPQRRGRMLLRKVSDNYGNYAFREVDRNNTNGLWISFDDPDYAATKAKYAKDRALGGVTLYDLANDDFRGRCNRGIEYPILRSVRKALDIRMFEAPRTYASVLRRM